MAAAVAELTPRRGSSLTGMNLSAQASRYPDFLSGAADGFSLLGEPEAELLTPPSALHELE